MSASSLSLNSGVFCDTVYTKKNDISKLTCGGKLYIQVYSIMSSSDKVRPQSRGGAGFYIK